MSWPLEGMKGACTDDDASENLAHSLHYVSLILYPVLLCLVYPTLVLVSADVLLEVVHKTHFYSLHLPL